MVLKAAKNAIIIFLLLGIVCGVGYPALVTVIAQKAFPEQANGSIVYKDGKPGRSGLSRSTSGGARARSRGARITP